MLDLNEQLDGLGIDAHHVHEHDHSHVDHHEHVAHHDHVYHHDHVDHHHHLDDPVHIDFHSLIMHVEEMDDHDPRLHALHDICTQIIDHEHALESVNDFEENQLMPKELKDKIIK